jgi:phosphohistidine phosphatase
MPRLLLLRHAKSAWGDQSLADIDRTLAPRGQRAAQLIAEAIAKGGLRPDRILCSPALRTRETLAALISHLGDEDVEIEISHALYEPHAGDYCKVIADRGNAAEMLMVIGHNPAIQATAILLSGGGDPAIASQIALKFPAGALAVLDFEGPWARIGARSGTVVAFVTPKGLAKDGAESDGDD